MRGDLGRHLRRPGSSPPRPGLAPWESLISIARTGASPTRSRSCSRLKRPARVAAAEVAGADLEDELAAVAVRGREAALAGVLQAAGELRAAVERLDRDRRERAVAHPGDVHHRRRAERVAAPVARRRGPCRRARCRRAAPPGSPGARRGRRERRVLDDQQALDRLHLVVGPEAEHVRPALRGGVDPAPLVAREGPLLVVGGDDVLAQLGAERLEQVAEVPDDREVAQDGVAALDQVVADHPGEGDQRAREGEVRMAPQRLWPWPPTGERRLPESNRCKRLCRPLRSHSAKAPRGLDSSRPHGRGTSCRLVRDGFINGTQAGGTQV